MSKSRRKKKPGTLDSLSGEDALSILRTLAQRDQKLARKIDAVATELLGGVDPAELAGEVQAALESLEVEDVWDRAGEHRDGYVDPGDAAWEMFEEALAPFRREVEKCRRLGLLKDASAQCQGILQGIHDFEHESKTQYQEWATDAPAEYFGEVLRDWKKLYRGRPPLAQMRQFIEGHCPSYA